MRELKPQLIKSNTIATRRAEVILGHLREPTVVNPCKTPIVVTASDTSSSVSNRSEKKNTEIYTQAVGEIKINFKELRETLEGTTHIPTKVVLLGTLETVQQKVIVFERNRVDQTFSNEVSIAHKYAWEVLSELEAVVETDKAKIRGADANSKQISEVVFERLLNACDAVKKTLIPLVISTTTPEPLWQKHRLRFDQQLLLSGSINSQFTAALQEIAKRGRSYRLPRSVFICYAWPNLESESEKHLNWVQSFLKVLRSHLHQAGLAGVKLDIMDNPPGGNIEAYMRGARDADFVLLIGTESLLFKHAGGGTSAVCTELSHIRAKRREDHAAGKQRVFPLLISGNYPEAFPAEYDRYNTIKEWKGGPRTYFDHLCWLIPALYNTEPEAFEDIWEKFLKNLARDDKILIKLGLTQEGVEDRLLAEDKQKQADQVARNRASRILSPLSDTSIIDKKKSEEKENKRSETDRERSKIEVEDDSFFVKMLPEYSLDEWESRNFKPILQELKTLAAGKNISCFVSYPWGVKSQEELVRRLAGHLELAGVRILIDVKNLIFGTRHSAYSHNILRTTHVILGCSQLLMSKLKSEKPFYIKNEVRIIEDKLKKLPTASVIPILLDGEMKISIPEFLYDIYSPDYRNPYNYYITTFLLAAGLLDIPNSEYQHLLKKLEIAAKEFQVPVKPFKTEETLSKLAPSYFSAPKSQERSTDSAVSRSEVKGMTQEIPESILSTAPNAFFSEANGLASIAGHTTDSLSLPSPVKKQNH